MKTLALLLIVSSGVVLDAQQPAAKNTAPSAAPATKPVDPGPTPPANYNYEPQGRRDPFVSLINRGADSRPAAARAARPDGVAGVMVDEVAVRGIVQSRGGYVAMIAAPNGRTYTVRPGDRLMDGNIRTITSQAIVLMQQVNDPLSLEKQREVRKYLRGEVK